MTLTGARSTWEWWTTMIWWWQRPRMSFSIISVVLSTAFAKLGSLGSNLPTEMIWIMLGKWHVKHGNKLLITHYEDDKTTFLQKKIEFCKHNENTITHYSSRSLKKIQFCKHNENTITYYSSSSLNTICK